MARATALMHTMVCIALCVLGLTERVAADAPAATENVTEAERYADQAFQAYEAKHYVDAVTLYRKSYSAAPSAGILYNIARIYDVGLRDRPLAISFYRQYVSDPGAEPKYITTANERLLALRAAEEAAVNPSVEGDASAAAAPSASQARLPSASAPAGAGAKSSATPAVSSREHAPKAESGLSSLRIAAVATVVAGVAGIGLGAGFGIAAMSDANTAKAHCDGNRCSTQTAVDAAESAKTKGTISTLGFALGGACLAAGAILWWVSGSGSSQEETARLHVVPIASSQVVGALLHGGF